MRCGAKNTYTTRDRAKDILAKIKTRRESGTFEDYCWAKRAYYCSEHSGWHLTKTDLKRAPESTDVLQGDY